LQSSHVSNDGNQVAVTNSRDRWHVAKIPVVLSRPTARGKDKGFVRVVVGLVQLMNQRRTLIGSHRLLSMTFTAKLHEGLKAF